MGVPITSTARAALAEPVIELRKSLYIVTELYNADLRTLTDVSRLVLQWGNLTGPSTLKDDNWVIPSMSPTLACRDGENNIDGYLIPDHPNSLWVEEGVEPKECWVKFVYDVKLPNGTWETVHTYYGKISDSVVKSTRGEFTVDLVTRHAADEALNTGISKSTGDMTQVIGSGW